MVAQCYMVLEVNLTDQCQCQSLKQGSWKHLGEVNWTFGNEKTKEQVDRL